MKNMHTSKRAVEALWESEERFRRLVENAADAFFVADLEGRLTEVNQRACDDMGYTRQELLTMSVWDMCEEITPERFGGFVKELASGGSLTREGCHRRKDGTTYPVELRACLFESRGRQLVLALARDITERKRAEAALKQYSANLEKLVEERTALLRQSEERHRILLEINNAVIANLDRESLFNAIAQAFRRFLSFDRASFTLYDPVRDVLKVYALTGLSPSERLLPLGAELPRQGSRVGWVLDQKRPVRVRDLRAEPHPVLEDHPLVAAGIRSVVVVPLLAQRGAIGTLNVGSKAPNQYSEEDALFLQDIAKQIALAVENMQAYEEIATLKARLQEENVYLQEEIETNYNFEEVIGESRVLKKILKTVETVAVTDTTILLLGETGTGKELIARAIHHLSPRQHRTLVKVNCAALPAGLIESELFGHEKGAFTGALSRKLGRFELADRGTIFLDEIGDLPLELQPKLLRVLQEGEFERVGGSHTIKVDVRVIAATNRELEKALQEGRFRPDLYYRLYVFPLRLPPLRERQEDIPLLVKYFVLKYGTKLGKKIKTIPQTTMEALKAYPWPGNIRELEHMIERAVILSHGSRLELGEWRPTPGVRSPGARIVTLAELEREHILAVLGLTGWRVSGEKGAAKLLGLKPTTLEARMKKLGIKRQG